ncbi:MAG: CarD family transcriptional regulator [Atopobiaceae bacterium]|jgi:CarD family transcriptional regulator|nr:CarD family transcriptional regulator [Atopobiaceae bacterium]
MYNVGEYIVHPGQGVCRIEELVTEPMEAYRLLPIGMRHPTYIRFPVANSDKLRRVLTRDEAEELIEEYPSMQVDDYTDRSNALEEEHFKQEIRKGTCRDSVRIVKTFRTRIAETRARNKKPPVAYERILKQASQRSLEELSVALEMSVDDVRMLFERQIDSSEN